MRIRTKLKAVLLILMRPLHARTGDKIREQQHNLAASPSGQLISSTGEIPGIMPTIADNNHFSRYSKRLAEAINRYSIFEKLPSSRKLIRELLPGIGVNLLAASRRPEEEYLQLRGPLPFRARALQKWLEAQPVSATAAEESRRTSLPHEQMTRAMKTSFVERPFGVNLICHAFNVFGIGEDSRAIAYALRAAATPFCVINHPARNGSATSERKLEELTLPPSEEGPFVSILSAWRHPSMQDGFVKMV
ncbi:hypothetical protein NZK32_03425 [Cyanobium sp. FGCU-52]|nr:hypothetical protein [Cyanobium sp. FGCU52]